MGIQLNPPHAAQARKAHVHHTFDDWEITSDISIECILDAETELLTHAYPGNLGTYILPRDATLSFLNHKKITAADLKRIVLKEKNAMLMQKQYLTQTNHFSFTERDDLQYEHDDDDDDDDISQDTDSEDESVVCESIEDDEEEDETEDVVHQS